MGTHPTLSTKEAVLSNIANNWDEFLLKAANSDLTVDELSIVYVIVAPNIPDKHHAWPL